MGDHYKFSGYQRCDSLGGGINPADYLARIVDVVDKPLFGLRFTARAGW